MLYSHQRLPMRRCSPLGPPLCELLDEVGVVTGTSASAAGWEEREWERVEGRCTRASVAGSNQRIPSIRAVHNQTSDSSRVQYPTGPLGATEDRERVLSDLRPSGSTVTIT